MRNFDYGFIYGLKGKDFLWVRFGNFSYGLELTRRAPFIKILKATK